MKIYRILYSFFVIFLLSQIHFSIAAQDQSKLIDEFGKENCEPLKSRLDVYALAIQNSDEVPTILFYGENFAEGDSSRYINGIKSYLARSKGIKEETITILRGENREKMLIQFYLTPKNSETIKPVKEFTKIPISSTTKFDADWADVNTDFDGRKTIDDVFCETCCSFDYLNRQGFAALLASEPDLTGYVIIYTRFGKGKRRADNVGKIISKELISKYNLPPQKFKVIYGGNREFPEAELWLAPKNGEPPELSPEKKN